MMSQLLALAVLLTLTAASVAAQPVSSWAEPLTPPPQSTQEAVAPPPEPPSDPQQVPIDGGLTLLALAGGAYAARRLRASR